MISPSRRIRAVAVLAIALFIGASRPHVATAQIPKADSSLAGVAPRDLPLGAAERKAYVGLYRVTMPSGDTETMRVTEENGVLKGKPGNPMPNDPQQPIRLLYQGDHAFRPEGVPDFIFHFELAGGRATSFTVHKEDGLMRGVRVE
jgi:hypothetical protein